VLFSRIRPDRLAECDSAEAGFSFGLGALGETGSLDQLSFGELVTVPGLAAVVPGDRPGAPRISQEASLRLFTPFRCVLAGIVNRPLRKIPLSAPVGALELWERLEAIQREGEGVISPLLGAVLFVEFENLHGAYVRKNPVSANAPEGGRPIIDPAVHAEWFGVQPDGGAASSWAVIVGVGLRQDEQLRERLGGRDAFIFYRHPDAPPAASPIAVHQHALLFEGVSAPVEGRTAGETVREWLAAGSVFDVKHVLEDSRIRSVWAATVPFENIELDGRQA